DLAEPGAGPAFRRLMAFEVARARAFLDRGAPLAGMLAGRPRRAVAAFAARGRGCLGAPQGAGVGCPGGAPAPGVGARGRPGPEAPDPLLAALADARHRFGLPVGAFGDLLDGTLLDVKGTRYQRFEDLEAYCRLVAGSVGRLSVAVFGSAEPARASRLADDLG